ncbi:MAG: alpha/beta fold hydrolase [Deltaproteobacteria bacterium]|nr:alpha/beta fold hydrolase [Deltaproteobacteria bacterium]
MNATRVFIHGLESSGRGVKGEFFRKRYPDMIIEDFTGDLADRMNALNMLLADKTDMILVGSSYGGLMAAIFACEHEERVKKLILLAPAVGLPAFGPFLDRRLSVPVEVFQGSFDNVLPLEPTREICSMVFSHLTFIALDDDHSLHRTFATLDWDVLLEAS